MSLAARVAALEEKVAALEGGRSGRKTRPVVVRMQGVCGVDPESDPVTCPYGSLYRRRKGCLGDACVQASNDYYDAYHGRTVAPTRKHG